MRDRMCSDCNSRHDMGRVQSQTLVLMAKMSCLDCGIPTQRSRCDQCQTIRDASTQAQRPTAHARGYDYAWKVVRLRVLERDGWRCSACSKKLEGADATVDHRVPLASGGARLDMDNLQAMCRKHNSAKGNR